MQCGFFLTAIWTFLLFQYGVQLSKVLATRPPGYLDFDNLPETNFTCEDKVIGGYYADIETGCQMFHVCTIGQKGDMTDIKFLCLNGTVFDQETRVCERVDEVDCSRSRDFYDLNLELYNNGFVLSGEEATGEDSKSVEGSESDEAYDDNYDVETEEPPMTTTKGSRTTTSTTTTTTTTTTTPKPIIFSTIKPTYGILIPKNKSPGTHVIGIQQYENKNGQATGKPIVSLVRGSPPPVQHNYQGLIINKQQQQENKNVGTHLTGVIPNKGGVQTPRPYGYLTTQGYDQGQHSLESGLKPPPTSYKPYISTTSYKPPQYDTYKNHYFPSSTAGPITSILINNYNQKHQDEIHSSEQAKRPVVVVSHHFPTITPVKGGYEEYGAFAALSGPGGPYVRRQQPHQQQQQQQRPSIKIQHHQPLKPNPTILALQSQQKKVHQLHQEGLEIAEHQIAQVASRNAEISNLRSQKMEDRKDFLETQSSHRETKEIHSSPFSKPSIAIVTSTSSTSSRIQNKPVVTTYVKTVTTSGRRQSIPEYKQELEKLFATAEHEKKQSDAEEEDEDVDDDDDDEEGSDMDLEQLLLAWKLKTNQEVTKEDIERVFSSLDTSKFKNGETISLSDIFKIMNNGSFEETTRASPINYDDYTEEDVPYDPFYKDVPKVGNSPARLKRSEPNRVIVRIRDNGRFIGREVKKRGKMERGSNERILVANVKLIDAVTTETPFPETAFTCRGKIPGGLYADTEVDCRLFHICSIDGDGSLADHKFFCGGGTRFDQRSRTCEAESAVDCSASPAYYHLNDNGGLSAEIPPPPEATFEPLKVKS